MGDILWKWKSEIRTLGPYYCPQVNVQYWASKLFRVWILNNPLLAVLAGMFWSNVCKSNQGSWPGLSQEEASSVATIATHSVLGSSVERGSIALVGQLVTVQSLLRSDISRTPYEHVLGNWKVCTRFPLFIIRLPDDWIPSVAFLIFWWLFLLKSIWFILHFCLIFQRIWGILWGMVQIVPWWWEQPLSTELTLFHQFDE